MQSKPRQWIIYKLTCRATGMGYIGATSKTLERRWSQHLAMSKRRGNAAINQAVREHGPDAFDKIILEAVTSRKEALLRERALIAEHNTLSPNGLNCTTGSEKLGGSRYAQETCAKISSKMKMAYSTNEGRITQSIRAKSEWASEEFRAEHAERMKEIYSSPKGRNIQSERAKVAWAKDEYRALHSARVRVMREEAQAARDSKLFAPLVGMDESHIDAIKSGKDPLREELIIRVLMRLKRREWNKRYNDKKRNKEECRV